jgi:hypothetical protein
MKIYLAGKISHGDWRAALVSGALDINYAPSGMEVFEGEKALALEAWPVRPASILGRFDYTGPYLVSCDHGCYHGAATHGMGLIPGEDQAHGWGKGCMGKYAEATQLVSLCLNAIDNSDIVFAWLDGGDAYGTLVELGYAYAEGKRIWLAASEFNQELWFAWEMASATMIGPTAEHCFEEMVKRLDQGKAILPPEPKAIQTEYKGYRFRSRLEARWAVFLDSLGIPYEYEKDGYDLDGLWYLPDFWLPDHGCWLEIKAKMNWDDDSWDKAHKLAAHTGYPCYLVAGQAWPEEYVILEFPATLPEDIHDTMSEGEFALCKRCDSLAVREHENRWRRVGPHKCAEDDRWPLMGAQSPRLLAAYKAARSARFEHGEKG